MSRVEQKLEHPFWRRIVGIRDTFNGPCADFPYQFELHGPGGVMQGVYSIYVGGEEEIQLKTIDPGFEWNKIERLSYTGLHSRSTPNEPWQISDGRSLASVSWHIPEGIENQVIAVGNPARGIDIRYGPNKDTAAFKILIKEILDTLATGPIGQEIRAVATISSMNAMDEKRPEEKKLKRVLKERAVKLLQGENKKAALLHTDRNIRLSAIQILGETRKI